MTAADLDALDKLRGAATPGPWHMEQHTRLRKGCMCLSCWEERGAWDIREVDGPDCPDHDCWHNISLNEPDAALIVAAINALPNLIAEARKYRALRETVEGLAAEMSRSTRPADEWVGRIRAVVATVDGEQ